MKFFKDVHGKWAVVQFPNPLLLTWLILVIASMLVTDSVLRRNINSLDMAILFAWSYFELTSGVSRFRQALGGFILIMIVVSYFS